tara:strand:+ start:187 stop:633 length:447 start_codon:yes stop_codon:yes gene_type:complete
MSFLLNKIISYFVFLRYYLVATFFGVIVDLVIYTYLRNQLNIISSASISFILSQITVFSILNTLQLRKIKRKRYALIFQFLIGLGTVSIHIMILKFLDSNFYLIGYLGMQNILKDKNLYSITTKFIAACFGFIWTSLMTKKFIFTQKK